VAIAVSGVLFGLIAKSAGGTISGDERAQARTAIIDFILGQVRRSRFQIPETGLEILGTARLIQQRYASLDLDLADRVNVALAGHYRTDAVLTLGRRDLRAMRPLAPHKFFRLLPDDL
jgi:hypothetical protein